MTSWPSGTIVFQASGMTPGSAHHDAAVGRVVVGFHKPRACGTRWRRSAIKAPHQDFERRAGLGQVAEHNVHALGRHAAIDIDDQVAAVVGDARPEQIAGPERFAAEFAPEDQGVFDGRVPSTCWKSSVPFLSLRA